MPVPKTTEKIFDDIQNLYLSEEGFSTKIKQYFTENFLSIDGEKITLSSNEQKQFEQIFDRAVKKLDQEIKESNVNSKTAKAINIVKSIGRFIASVASFGIWRSSPIAKKQFESLVEYSNKITQERETLLEQVRKHDKSIQKETKDLKEKATKTGQELFNQYVQGNFTRSDIQKKLDAASKIMVNNKEVDDHITKDIIKKEFDRLASERRVRLLNDSHLIRKFDLTLKHITKQTKQQEKVESSLARSTKALTGRTMLLKSKVSKALSDLHSRITHESTQGIPSIDELTSNNLNLVKQASNLERDLKQLEHKIKTIKDLQERNTRNLNKLEKIKEQIDLLESKQTGLEETSPESKKLKSLKEEILKTSKYIESQQIKLAKQHRDLQGQIELQRLNLAEIRSNNQIMTEYQKKLGSLLKQINKENNRPVKEEFFKTLTKTLKEQIPPATDMFGYSYEDQRNDAVNLIVEKYKKEFEKSPMITGDYILKHQDRMLDDIVKLVSDPTKQYLGSNLARQSTFDVEMAKHASSVRKELMDDIYSNLTKTLLDEVRQELQFKEKSVTDLKKSLTDKLKEEIPSVSGMFYGTYEEQRNAAIDSFVNQYVQKLEKSCLINSDIKKASVDTLVGLASKPLKDFVDTNYNLDVETTKVRIASSFDELAKQCVTTAVSEGQKKYVSAKVKRSKKTEHTGKWTDRIKKQQQSEPKRGIR